MTRDSQHHDGDQVGRPARATWLSLALLAAACGPDPQGKFEDYIDEAEEHAPKMDIPPAKEDIPPPDPGVDIGGTFLLAISTVISKDLPLQFVSTATQRVEDNGDVFIDLSLQPLSLDQGSVTEPRVPVGEPLVFKDIPVIDGKYVVDAGEVMVTGAANPITGSDIAAILVLDAQIKSEDFVCGAVSGMVTAPLMADITGSTFGSVRIADATAIPAQVTINCAGDLRPVM